jgi:murein DD-endopeptidase MepM/ murein hydrolase activator NlpD
VSLFIPPVNGKITYGWVPGVHRSVDYAVPVGTTVVAAAAGTVIAEGDYGAMGDTLRIEHANGYETLYGNLTTYSVPIGASVSQGQKIGTSGGAIGSKDPGDSTGPHVPFQVWLNGNPVNPASVTSGAGTSVQEAADITSTGAGTSVQEAADITSTASVLNPLAGLNQAGAAFGTIGSWLGNSGNWVRVGLGALGVVFLILAVDKLISATPTGQAIKSAATTAAKTAILA